MQKSSLSRPELLMPAGNFSIAKTAFLYGADAVYIGGGDYNLRAKAHNFSMKEIGECIEYAHHIHKLVYITVNIYAYNQALPGISDYLKELASLKPDGLIIADPGIFMLAKEIAPKIPIHISTQANTTNTAAVKFWQSQGAARVVLAREMTLRDIATVKSELNDSNDIKIEAFVHGSMCMAQSGRCLLSTYLTGKSANGGECTHPCRWKYQLVEEKRPDLPMPIIESPQGSFIFSANDLRMIAYIPELIHSGIDSFKVEGRMKNELYVAMIARAYKIAIDAALKSKEAFENVLEYCLMETNKCTHRTYSTGFYFGGCEDSFSSDSDVQNSSIYLGTVGEETKNDTIRLIQKNKFNIGDKIEILKPDGKNIVSCVLSIQNNSGVLCNSAPHAKEPLWVSFSIKPDPGDLLRSL